MHKLFWADFILSLMTILGATYLYLDNKITLVFAIVVVSIYIFSKIIAYLLLSYEKFDKFISFLIINSKLPFLSGFEIFKTLLVLLLFIGFIFISPYFWILESILVILMRIWGKTYFLSLK